MAGEQLQHDADAPQGIRAQARQKTVARIMSVAERAFAESGFAGASMAEIAASAGLAKANVLYYFGTKDNLYRSVIDDILKLWLAATDEIRADNDPAVALTAYIRAKMDYSKGRPFASKVFANEVLHGAPYLRTHFAGRMRAVVAEKAAVIEGWIAAGRMDRIDPRHLFFAIWAMTQTYADFEAQIRPVLGTEQLQDPDFEAGTSVILKLVLQGCGIRP